MISLEEGRRAIMVRSGQYFILEPETNAWGYNKISDGVPVPDGFHCASNKNDMWYGVEEIAKVLELNS